MTARWLPILLCTLVACGPTPAPSVPPTTAPAVVPAAAATIAPASTPSTDAPPRIVVLVRHGEKQSEARDAALSPAGVARAACLADALAELGVTHVFTTEFARTRDTAGPLAARLGLTPEVVPAAEKDAWLDRLNALPPGAIALVAGHSNTVPELVAALGAGEVAIAGDTYDKLFAVVLPEHGAPTLLRLHYCTAPKA